MLVRQHAHPQRRALHYGQHSGVRGVGLAAVALQSRARHPHRTNRRPRAFLQARALLLLAALDAIHSSTSFRFLNRNGANLRMIMVGNHVSDQVRGAFRLAEMAVAEHKVPNFLHFLFKM
jgi:hypothetical protein